jgi:hypothetical protein
MALVMMAMQFMLETRIKNAELLPLLSCYDIQILIATRCPTGAATRMKLFVDFTSDTENARLRSTRHI